MPKAAIYRMGAGLKPRAKAVGRAEGSDLSDEERKVIGNGLHLMIDGVMGKPVTSEQVGAFLLGCAEAIEMEVIAGPFITEIAGEMTGVVIIAQSDIIIHAYSDLGTHVDIFSCMEFDEGKALRYTIDTLGLTGLKTQKLWRGWVAHWAEGSDKSDGGGAERGGVVS